MKLLVFVDPGVEGDWALALAEDLANRPGASLLLLTTPENVKKDPEILNRAATRFGKRPELVIETKVRPGPPREAIIAESRESRPTITVVPPAGRKGLARMLRGSRVKAVVHKAPSTIMVARKPVSDHIRSVLVTVSGGPMSETTALCALEIAEALQAQLTLLHVTSSVSLPYGDAGREPGVQDISGILKAVSQEGREPRVRSRNGMVINEVLHECEDGGYDLLILGQHLMDRKAGGPFSENLSEVLALECQIPVLVVRPRRWAEEAAIE
jgi:nucleotide-binding universal stress UspA family protein